MTSRTPLRAGLPLLPAAILLAAISLATSASAQERLLIRAERVYTAAGDPVGGDGGAFVALEGGRIAAVGPGSGGGDAIEVGAVTPGLIDLSVRIGTGEYSVEQSDETPVELGAADSLDLFSHRWERELRSGVTCALATPLDKAVLAGRGVVIKTGGAPTLEARLVKADAVLRASMGSQPSHGNFPPRFSVPSTFYARRPTTRMGVEWVARKAFYDALGAQKTGAELAPRERERADLLLSAMRGDLPVSVQAWGTQDVRTAVYLKEEFGIPRMFVDAAAEAWKEPELLVRSGMGAVLPPFSLSGRIEDPWSNATYFLALDAAAKLHAAGVTVALSGHGAEDPGARLPRQAGLAMRGGLPFEAALEAVTINPARLVGIEDRVGSIEVGKDADLVLWSGKPFEITSRILGVVLNGVLAVDLRPPSESP